MNPTNKAHQGLDLLKEALLEYLEKHPDGVGNSEIARNLQLESDFQGSQRNYLSWSVLGLLVNDGQVIREKQGHTVRFKLPRSI